MILRLLILTQYQRVADGRLDTPPMPMARSSIDERAKTSISIIMLCLTLRCIICNVM